LVVHGGKWPTHGSSWELEVVSPKLKIKRKIRIMQGGATSHDGGAIALKGSLSTSRF
jgi:hypothetical protein